MKGERGQALILVLVLLVVGSLMVVPLLQLVSTNLTAGAMYGQFLNDDYAMDCANEYVLWLLRWKPGFAADLQVGESSAAIYVTCNGVEATTVVTAEATSVMSGFGLVGHQIKPTKTVEPETADAGVSTTFTYTINLERLEPDDAVFSPLESIKDAMDAGFIYVINSSKLDGVAFNDNDLSILQEPVIVTSVGGLQWSMIADEDTMVSESTPDQKYGSELTMDVSSGVLSSSDTARSFLKIDISSIPVDAVIQSATLRLWAESYPGATRTYEVHRVTEDWTESGVDWNNQPAAAAATASIPTPSDIATPMEWNVSADVQDWRDGVFTNYGWRISDDAEDTGTEHYANTVTDTLEFDTLKGATPNIIPISGDVYAIAYAGDGDDGFLKTVTIATDGQITDTVIDTLEFDTLKGATPKIIPISGDIYAIAYAGDGDDGWLKTVEISSGGDITYTVIDSLEFDGIKGKTPDIIPISGDVYAIAYAGDGDDGFLKTVEISGSGTITDTIIDTMEFDTARGKTPDIMNVLGDIYVIAYAGDGDDGFLKTVSITASGDISDTLLDDPEFDPFKGIDLDIIRISGDVYAIAYAGDGDDGFVKTVQIAFIDNINHTTVFHTMDDSDPGETVPILVVEYLLPGGDVFQTIEWLFEPDLDFNYAEERTLSFEAVASLADDSMFWNAAILQPWNSYTGLTAPITVGSPDPDAPVPGAGITVTKTAEPAIVYADIPALVTYVISITNEDTEGFTRLDRIIDYLPLGFSYVPGSAMRSWSQDNSNDNDRGTGFPKSICAFEPQETLQSDGRWKLDWHNRDVGDYWIPYDPDPDWEKVPEAAECHDFEIAPGITYTQTFQALADVAVSGSYPNEVFAKLKDSIPGDRGLGQDKEVYSWPAGEVVVPAYDILTETERATLRTNAAITLAGITTRSWHWTDHE